MSIGLHAPRGCGPIVEPPRGAHRRAGVVQPAASTVAPGPATTTHCPGARRPRLPPRSTQEPRDRRRALRLGQHAQVPPPQHPPQARRGRPRRRRGVRRPPPRPGASTLTATARWWNTRDATARGWPPLRQQLLLGHSIERGLIQEVREYMNVVGVVSTRTPSEGQAGMPFELPTDVVSGWIGGEATRHGS